MVKKKKVKIQVRCVDCIRHKRINDGTLYCGHRTTKDITLRQLMNGDIPFPMTGSNVEFPEYIRNEFAESCLTYCKRCSEEHIIEYLKEQPEFLLYNGDHECDELVSILRSCGVKFMVTFKKGEDAIQVMSDSTMEKFIERVLRNE